MVGGKARESKPDTDDINSNADKNLTSGQEITQYAGPPSVNPFDLLVYTFVCEHDDTKQQAEVKDSL